MSAAHYAPTPVRAWASNTVLTWALGASLAAHAALLMLRFAAPAHFERIFEDTPLEVILVNSQSIEQPEKAQAIAQAALAGGGDAEAGRATSPLPYADLTHVGDDLEHQDQQRQIQALLAQQMQLLAHTRSQLQAQIAQLQQAHEASDAHDRQQREQRIQALLQQLSEIEQRIHSENARPRKRYISPATKEAAFAIYYDALRRRVEDRGTQNFPEHAGQKLYGQLLVELVINHDGQLIAATVERSSGNAMLDKRAIAIAAAAAPFGHFTQAMRASADQIAVLARFSFSHDEGVRAQLHAQ